MGVEKSAGGYKRLGFVREYSTSTYDYLQGTAEYVYSNTKAYAPASIKPTIDQVEAKSSALFKSYGVPLLTAVTDTSEGVLKNLDSTVDDAASYLEKKHWFVEARETYLGKIKNGADFISKQGFQGTVKYAADAVLARVEEAKKVPSYLSDESKVLVKHVEEAWNRLVSYPMVSNLMATAQPSIDWSLSKYTAAHDALVTSPAYNQAFKTGADSFNKVADMPIYKNTASRIYPVVQPYVEPVYAKVTSSDVYHKVIDHVKPVPVKA